MREIALLLGVELRGMWGFGRLRHVRDPRERRRGILLGVVWAMLGVMCVGYVSALAVGLCMLELGALVPAYLALLASLVCLMLGLWRAGAMLFSAQGCDTLAAMPLRPASVFAARWLCLYLEDLALSALALIPGLIVCAIYGALSPLGLLVGLLALPLLPLTSAALIGTGIALLAARMRRPAIAQTLLMLAVVGLTLGGSALLVPMVEMTPDALGDLAATVGDLIATLYPPADWFGQAVAGTAYLPGLALIGLSLAASLAFCLPVAPRFFAIVAQIAAVRRRRGGSAAVGQGQSSHLHALWVRELRHYFASSVYVTNTIISPLLAVALGIALCVVGTDTVTASLPLPVDLRRAIPFALAAVVSLMPPAAVSLSMEGKQVWLLKTLPLSVRTVIDAKLAASLTVTGPGVLIGGMLCAIALRELGPASLWGLVVPAVCSLFSTVFALTVDRALHRFDQPSEAVTVKQSASSGLGGLLPGLICFAGAAIVLLVPDGGQDLACAGVCALLCLVAALLYRRLMRDDIAKW